MKRLLAYFMLVCMLSVFFEATHNPPCEAAEKKSDKEAAVREVYDFIKGCNNYYLATVEGDQPHVRPFGSLAIFEGKIYFQTGKVKSVSKQISVNPKIEICAFDNKGKWVRVQAIAVNDDRRTAKQFLIDTMPGLEKMYSADDDNTQVLYLKDATAVFYSFTEEKPKVIKF
ncbi:pyridoxamine 5'-phosphate oxidase [Synergistales bacterium]|nr:pyridoxamine 5'-phosphate oxidase [Synergistales bacterium]